MILPGPYEIWFVLIYGILAWLSFALGLYLADDLHRKKEAMVGALLILVLASVLSMLAGFAAEQLQTGLLMSMAFQLTGIVLCVMAVSRVTQMLSWPRTWLAALLALIFYILAAVLVGWGLAMTI